MSKEIPYPCVGGPGGSCKSLCCFQAADALKSIVDLKLSGQPVDPAIFDFPHRVDKVTGRCEKLSEDNSFCTVYLERPILCSIEKACEAMNLDPVIFLPANAEQCNAFMTEAGIAKEQQIDVEAYRLRLLKETMTITDPKEVFMHDEEFRLKDDEGAK